MKIVKFKDGKYGIRRWSWWGLEYKFRDLTGPSCWWSSGSSFLKDSRGTLHEVNRVYKSINDKGTPYRVYHDPSDPIKMMYVEAILDFMSEQEVSLKDIVLHLRRHTYEDMKEFESFIKGLLK